MSGANLNSLLWPGLAAVGERMWSPRPAKPINQTHIEGIVARLVQFRCNVLIPRGIESALVGPGYKRGSSIIAGGDAPHGPGSCTGQL